MSDLRPKDLLGIQDEVRRLKLENEALRNTISCVEEVLDEFRQNPRGNPFKENRMALCIGRISGIVRTAEESVAWALEHGYTVDHRAKKSPGR